MDLQFDTEHGILRDSAERFLRERYDYARFRESSTGERGWSPEIWSDFANLGWLGIPFAVDDGGVGGGGVEVSILMEAFGQALVVEPYVPTVVLCGGLISLLEDAPRRAALLQPIIEGAETYAFAHDDAGSRTIAATAPNGYVLAGAKKAVAGAPGADTLLVSAAIGSRTGVFRVPADAPGVTIRPYRTVDGRRAGDIELSAVTVSAASLLGASTEADTAIESAIDRAIAALSAEAVGALATMVRATVDYAKLRVQFGQPIAKFQALQHRLVDMKVREEEARAACLFATLSLDSPAPRRRRAVSGAKAKIGRNARSVAQNAVQLHGAIGTTQELSLGAYAKRLLAYEVSFGSTREHLRRYGELIASPGIAGDCLLIPAAG